MSLTTNDLNEAVELLNRIFDVPLGWLDDRSGRLLPENARELQEYVARLIEVMSDDIVAHAAYVAAQQEDAIPFALKNPELMLALPGSIEVFRKWRESVIDPEFYESAGADWGYTSIRPPLSDKEVDRIFELFISSESLVLKDAGFNQNSVAIIIQRVIEKAPKIKAALRRKYAKSPLRYDRSLGSLENTAKRLTVRTSEGRIAMIASRDVIILKDKVTALAVILGDVMPLLLLRDWGVTSVVSTIAGAAVGAMMPSERRR